LTVLIKNPNFLILDEPTNDLDLLTLQALEDFITDFQGCLLIVSHDRYFMDQVVDQLFVFEGNGEVKGFIGNYTAYRDAIEAKQKEEKNPLQPLKQKGQSDDLKTEERPKKSKRTFKEQQEYLSLELEMSKLEEEKATLVRSLGSSEMNYLQLNELSERITAIDKSLDIKMERWMLLDEIGV